MTASVEGYVRIIRADPSEFLKEVLWEGRTEPLDASTTDPQQMIQVPPDGRNIPEDWKLIVEMKGDSATIVDNTSIIRIPARVRNLATKSVYDKDITGADLGLSATDVAIGTSFTRVGAYTVSSGEEIRFGKQARANSQMMINLAYT